MTVVEEPGLFEGLEPAFDPGRGDVGDVIVLAEHADLEAATAEVWALAPVEKRVADAVWAIVSGTQRAVKARRRDRAPWAVVPNPDGGIYW